MKLSANQKCPPIRVSVNQRFYCIPKASCLLQKKNQNYTKFAVFQLGGIRGILSIGLTFTKISACLFKSFLDIGMSNSLAQYYMRSVNLLCLMKSCIQVTIIMRLCKKKFLWKFIEQLESFIVDIIMADSPDQQEKGTLSGLIFAWTKFRELKIENFRVAKIREICEN